MNEESLAGLIERAKEGDREAFRVLFDRLHGKLYSFAVSHVGDREASADLVQDTLVALWEELPKFSYRSDEAFFAFVYIILRRKVARHHGSKKKLSESLDERLEFLGDAAFGEEGQMTPQYEDHRYLFKAMDRLSTSAREILALRYWSELSFAEVAATLGITETAAKVRHHRAMKELRDHYAEYGHAGTH